MVPVICLNDADLPARIPPDLRVKKGEWYHITEIAFCKPQNVDGISLYEKPLGDKTHPYRFYRFERFGIKKEDIPKLEELIEQCNTLGEVDSQALLNEILTEQLETI
jgi:hypothetical protein